ncbi:MAG: hypothetical protein GY927_07820 [bacterium]|nr:hypothetical protein [bacterium]
MAVRRVFDQKEIKQLEDFVQQNPEADFKLINLEDGQALNALNWMNFSSAEETLPPLLKAYQRLLRIIPDEQQECAYELLRMNIHSAVQIASMTKIHFLKKCAKILKDNPQLGIEIYKNAQAKRSTILVQYMDQLQNNEPHIKATIFN